MEGNIITNTDAQELGLYAGAAGVGIAVGAALAVRGTSDLYRGGGRRSRKKDKEKAEEVLDLDTRSGRRAMGKKEMKKIQAEEERRSARLERGSRHTDNDRTTRRVTDVNDAYAEAMDVQKTKDAAFARQHQIYDEGIHKVAAVGPIPGGDIIPRNPNPQVNPQPLVDRTIRPAANPEPLLHQNPRPYTSGDLVQRNGLPAPAERVAAPIPKSIQGPATSGELIQRNGLPAPAAKPLQGPATSGELKYRNRQLQSDRIHRGKIEKELAGGNLNRTQRRQLLSILSKLR